MKQAYHHRDLRNALVDEAIVVLAEAGPSRLTLRELARRVGVTHTAPYAHFADKQALLDNVASVGFTRLGDALEAEKAESCEPNEVFAAMTVAYIRFALDSPHLYRLMFERPGFATGEIPPRPSERARAFDALADGVLALEPAPGHDPRELSLAAWALVHGLALLEIDRRTLDQRTRGPAELVATASKVFMRGLREPQGSAPAPWRGPVEPQSPGL